MNSFIFAKRYGFLDFGDGDVLRQATAEGQLNTPPLSVVEGHVLKGLRVKPPAKFNINTVQDILVERGRDALGVVIGRDEDRGRFFQIDAQEKDILRAQNGCRPPEELDTFFRREVPQTGPEKGHGFLLQLKRLKDLRFSREIGMHGTNLNMGIFLQESVGRVP